MQNRNEVLRFIRETVKKYKGQEAIDTEKLHAVLVKYAEPSDIEYYVSNSYRQELSHFLSQSHTSVYAPLAKALLKCLDMHPPITGAFSTGSHANATEAVLNDTIVQLIGDASSLIGIMEEHPDLESTL